MILKFLKKKREKKGQAILEYTLILMTCMEIIYILNTTFTPTIMQRIPENFARVQQNERHEFTRANEIEATQRQ